MSQELPIDLRTRLTGLDREIAVRAIAALARGTPVEAAYQILAGIEALDTGPESPMVMLWPNDDGYKTIEDRAAWHETEKDRLLAKLEESQRTYSLAAQRAAHRSNCQRAERPEHQADPSPASALRDDEQGRGDWHDAMLKNGVYQPEGNATSARNRRDPQ